MAVQLSNYVLCRCEIDKKTKWSIKILLVLATIVMANVLKSC